MPPVPKPEIVRDPDFLRWIAFQPCVVSDGDCRYERNPQGHLVSDACHYFTRRDHGDELVFPACRFHHQLQHALGVETFAQRFALKLLNLCRRFRREYLEGDFLSEGLVA
jgi:hypothetical protein